MKIQRYVCCRLTEVYNDKMPYCTDFCICSFKESVTCHKPYHSQRYFKEHHIHCSTGHLHYLKQKEKKYIWLLLFTSRENRAVRNLDTLFSFSKTNKTAHAESVYSLSDEETLILPSKDEVTKKRSFKYKNYKVMIVLKKLIKLKKVSKL